MLIVGLTGGIATGKSTVSKLLQENYSWPIVDADIIARQVVQAGTSAHKQIIEEFGDLDQDLLQDDGQINRTSLGKLVFGNPERLKVLNGIVHPAVRKEMIRQVLVNWIKGHPVVVLDVPLLFEGNLDQFCGAIVVVSTTPELQMQRLVDRNPELDMQDAERRVVSQLPLSEKCARADYVVENVGSTEDLAAKVQSLVEAVTPYRLTSTLEWLPPIGFAMAIFWTLKKRLSKGAKPQVI